MKRSPHWESQTLETKKPRNHFPANIAQMSPYERGKFMQFSVINGLILPFQITNPAVADIVKKLLAIAPPDLMTSLQLEPLTYYNSIQAHDLTPQQLLTFEAMIRAQCALHATENFSDDFFNVDGVLGTPTLETIEIVSLFNKLALDLINTSDPDHRVTLLNLGLAQINEFPRNLSEPATSFANKVRKFLDKVDVNEESASGKGSVLKKLVNLLLQIQHFWQKAKLGEEGGSTMAELLKQLKEDPHKVFLANNLASVHAVLGQFDFFTQWFQNTNLSKLVGFGRNSLASRYLATGVQLSAPTMEISIGREVREASILVNCSMVLNILARAAVDEEFAEELNRLLDSEQGYELLKEAIRLITKDIGETNELGRLVKENVYNVVGELVTMREVAENFYQRQLSPREFYKILTELTESGKLEHIANKDTILRKYSRLIKDAIEAEMNNALNCGLHSEMNPNVMWEEHCLNLAYLIPKNQESKKRLNKIFQELDKYSKMLGFQLGTFALYNYEIYALKVEEGDYDKKVRIWNEFASLNDPEAYREYIAFEREV